MSDGIGEGFSRASVETLLAVRENLLKGLDVVVEHLDAGTLHVIGPKRSSSPAEAGRITLGLLDQVNKELKRREDKAR